MSYLFTGTSISNIIYDILREPPYTQFWCWDPLDGNKRRREIYPEYKTKRPPTDDNIMSSLSYVRDMMEHTNQFSIEVPTYEADDVVASVACHMAAKGHEVQVRSTDADLYALEQLPNVTCSKKIEKIEPHEVRVYKALVGDKSDNIPGLPRFGEKSFHNYEFKDLKAFCEGGPVPEAFPTSMKKWVEENPDTITKYYQIIDFFMIPEDDLLCFLRTHSLNHKYIETELMKFHHKVAA